MSLNERFDGIKNDICAKDELINKNTESALVFMMNHFDTLKVYKAYRTRSQFRSHIIKLLDGEYGDNNYSKRDVLRLMDKEGYYSSFVYFLVSLAIVSSITWGLNYFLDSQYMMIFNCLIIVVGTLILTTVLDMWRMKG